MAKDTTEIYEQLVLIMKTHSKGVEEFSMEMHIAADLALDSVTMFELIMDVEDQFDINFSVEEGASLGTIKSLVEAISRKIAS